MRSYEIEKGLRTNDKNSRRKAIIKRDGNIIEITKIEYHFLKEQNEQLKEQNKQLQIELNSYKKKSSSILVAPKSLAELKNQKKEE